MPVDCPIDPPTSLAWALHRASKWSSRTDKAIFAKSGVARTEGGGRIDVLINNAGDADRPFLEQSKADDPLGDRGELLRRPHRLPAGTAGVVARHSGHIVDIASVAGMGAGPGSGGLRGHQVRGGGLTAVLARQICPARRRSKRGFAYIHPTPS
jgi:NADP-dependent 3-hydroxy acid dehydrogenase YdfG